MRRITRWTVGIISGLLLLAATSAVVVETQWFKERLRRIVVNRAAEVLNGQLTVGQLTGSLWTGVELHHVVISQPAGQVLAVETLSLRYDPRILLRGHLTFDELSLTRPVMQFVEQADGWNIATLVKPTTGGSRTAVQIRRMAIVDGDVTVEPALSARRHFGHLNSNLGLSYSTDRLQVNVDALRGQDVDTHLEVRGAKGSFDGTADRMAATISLDSTAGAVDGTISGQPNAAGRMLDGRFRVSHLDLDPIAARHDLASDITGTLNVQAALSTMSNTTLAASTVSFQIDAPALSAGGYSAREVKGAGSYAEGVLHVDAEGAIFDARGSVKGEWRTPSAARTPNTMQFAGRVRGLDLRRLPASLQVPRIESQVAGRYHFSYSPARWAVVGTLDRSTVEGAEVGAGTMARVESRGSALSYDVHGRVGHLDLHRLGRPLRIAALETDRFKSRIAGDFQVEGRGSGLNDTKLDARATLADSTIGPTHVPSATIAAHLDARRLEIDFAGPFEHLNNELLGVAPAIPVDLTGASEGLRVAFHDLSAPVSVSTVEASGRVTLGRSVVGGYDVDSADLDAALAGGAVTIHTFCFDGSELNATASGTVAFDAAISSNLIFTIDAANLNAAATRLGQPLAGSAHVVGAISGPRDHLTASGTINTQQFKYGTSVDALTVNGTFGVDVIDQQWRDLTARAAANATFLKLGGMDIEQLTAAASYHAGTLEVDTTIDQKDRHVRLTGNVAFEPEQEEVRLRTMAITTTGQTWSLTGGREAVIDYGAGRLSVRDLALANGPAQVGVSGVLDLRGGDVSSPGLDLKVDNVQLADLDQFLSGTWTVTGLLNGDAHLGGSTSAPDVSSTFTITGGAVSNTTFRSLAAKVGYRDHRVSLDATLDQQPGAQLKATGTIPFALGRGSTTGDEAADLVDLRVESTPIDLGIFQALTTEVTALKGTGQFHVAVTGTPTSPKVNGSVEVANASFGAPATGMTYRGGNARVRFDGDHLLIDQFVIEDDDRHTLTAEGGAEVASGRDVKSVDIHIASQDFHLLRNQYGELGLDFDVKASGTLQALDITGQARVERGRLEADKILDQFNKTAYPADSGGDPEMAKAADVIVPAKDGEAPSSRVPPVNPAESRPAETAPVSGEALGSGTPFEHATINVKLVMPENMIVRASDLRLSGGSVGLGSTNLTLGGSLTMQKQRDGNLTILGGIDVVRGFYEFQGKRFDIQRDSDVQFHGERPVNPTLNVDAARDISGVTAQVGLRGTARSPQIQLSSYPPLDQSDILSLIVFGQPVNALGESQRVSLAQRAGNLALGAVAGPLADSVGRALNLDLFEIRAEGEGGAPEVALGSQVGSRIFIGLRQEFGKEDVSTVSFEYRLSKLLRLVTSVAQGAEQTHSTRRTDPTGIDLIFMIRY